jgi:hypothetical protein
MWRTSDFIKICKTVESAYQKVILYQSSQKSIFEFGDTYHLWWSFSTVNLRQLKQLLKINEIYILICICFFLLGMPLGNVSIALWVQRILMWAPALCDSGKVSFSPCLICFSLTPSLLLSLLSWNRVLLCHSHWTVTCYVAQDWIPIHKPPQYWDYRCLPPSPPSQFAFL